MSDDADLTSGGVVFKFKISGLQPSEISLAPVSDVDYRREFEAFYRYVRGKASRRSRLAKLKRRRRS